MGAPHKPGSAFIFRYFAKELSEGLGAPVPLVGSRFPTPGAQPNRSVFRAFGVAWPVVLTRPSRHQTTNAAGIPGHDPISPYSACMVGLTLGAFSAQLRSADGDLG